MIEARNLVMDYLEFARTNKLQFFEPIAWQRKFHAMGTTYQHRMVSAANQTGKTSGGGGYEYATHLLGEYPSDWEGAEFDHAPLAWCAGVNLPQIAEVTQKVLFGERSGNGFDGSGFIPTSNIIEVKWNRQYPETAETVKVKGRNGVATHKFKAYSSTGAEKKKAQSLAGTTKLDLLLVDEQPPEVALGQMVQRTMHGKHCYRNEEGILIQRDGGLVLILYTPELGADALYTKFSENPEPTQGFMNVTWNDVEEHVLSAEQKAATLATIPPHEHQMRSMGIPMLGGSVVFPISEDSIKVTPFEVPDHWSQVLGIDFGINHPFACAKIAYDAESDCIYVIEGYRERNVTPPIHVSAMKRMGAPTIPTIYPHDGDTREKGSGQALIKAYEEEGLENTIRFSNQDGTILREPGIMDMLIRMETGRFKVFSTVNYFFEEMRLYHRKDGRIVDANDDFISATRYGAMAVGRYGVQPGRASAFEDDLADYYARIA